MPFDLDQLREGWDFEVKLAAGRDGRGAVPASFYETYSAMANTDGGTVVLGAAERPDGSFEVAGLGDIDRVEQDLWNQLDNRQKVSANVLRRDDVRREGDAGAQVLVITIPRADRKARPVYLNGNPLVAFRRSREGDRRCSEAEVRRMLADASDEPADSTILPGFGLADLDRDTIDAWRNLFRGRKPDHPFLAGDEAALLTRVGVWRRDRATGQEGLTVAGLLMFGQERAILDHFPHYQLDYREMVSEDPAQRWQDRVTVDGTWAGNLFAFYRRVILKLTADLKVPFRLDAELRRIDSTPAHEAVREALINALIHAQYPGTRGLRVFKRARSFEIINPGTLRVRWEDARAGNASDPRNPTLQKLFQLAGMGDRAGSGVPRIHQAWREQHWRAPALTEDFDNNEMRLVLSMESLLPDEVVADLDGRFADRFRALPEAKRSALVAAAAEGHVTNGRLQQVLDLHPRDLTHLLGDLVREGFLEPHGERAGRWYTLGSDQSAHSSDQSSVQSGPVSQQSPGEARSALVREVREAPWADAGQVRAAILAVCTHGYYRLPEVADALGRKAATIRPHIRALVKTRALTPLHPDSPTHPDQAYRSTPTEDPDER